MPVCDWGNWQEPTKSTQESRARKIIFSHKMSPKYSESSKQFAFAEHSEIANLFSIKIKNFQSIQTNFNLNSPKSIPEPESFQMTSREYGAEQIQSIHLRFFRKKSHKINYFSLSLKTKFWKKETNIGIPKHFSNS